jgi:hypothetical protein
MTEDQRRRAAFAAAAEKLKILNDDERLSLCEIGKPLARRIPDSHRDALIKAGLVEQVLGGLKLTFLGEGAAVLVHDGMRGIRG